MKNAVCLDWAQPARSMPLGYTSETPNGTSFSQLHGGLSTTLLKQAVLCSPVKLRQAS